jgi:hypothetical protein
MPFRRIYTKNSEDSVGTYSFTDIATGTGYKVFYGVVLYEGSTKTYALSPEAIASFRDEVSDASVTHAANTAYDVDLDIVITKPLILKGKAFVNVPLTINVGAGATASTTCTASLYYVRGGSETQIGSTATATVQLNDIGANQTEWAMFSARIDVPTTTLKSGDTIRLNVTTSAPGNDKQVVIRIDPTNTGVTSIIKSEVLSLVVPFKIDL